MSYEEFCSRYTVEFLSRPNSDVVVLDEIYKSNRAIATGRMEAFRKHLHDLLQEYIRITYKFEYYGDVDASLFTEFITNQTPDLYDPKHRVWGDVTITNDPDLAAETKKLKYERLVELNGGLQIFCYNTNNGDLHMYFHVKSSTGWVFRKLKQPMDYQVAAAINNGLLVFNSVRYFEDSEPAVSLLPEIEEGQLCPEAMLFSENDNGLLNDLINEGSSDSTHEDQLKMRKRMESRILKFAEEIASEAKTVKTDFKAIKTENLIESFNKSETFVQENFNIIEECKTSCHGLPGEMEKVPRDCDTRDFVVRRFYKLMKPSEQGIFQELCSAIDYNYNTLFNDRKTKRMERKKELSTLEPGSDEYKIVENIVRKTDHMQLWDRESLHVPPHGLIMKALRVGKKSKVKMGVDTIRFWDPLVSEEIKREIELKTSRFIREDVCWTPHKEYKPKLKEAGGLYLKFIQSRLYQEIAYVGQLAANILRLVTKPRKQCSITTAGNLNMAAIIGPGDGAMNEASTVPIIWLAIGELSQMSLWSKIQYKEGCLGMTNGDRLTKARLEQMVDAPRIASIAASICCVELQGKPVNIMYACGILSCVAMSINIRDSELIDHIRYMIPNIFSDRSCAAEYIVDKYSSPLKTGLQALLYIETKTTILESAKISKTYHHVEIENDEVVSGGVKMEIPFLGCKASSVFQLNGVVYTGFFSCKKGLHEPRTENKKMFDKICEFEIKSFDKNLIEASFDKKSYHYFDPEYVAFTMMHMIETYGSEDLWRKEMIKMDNLKRPFELKTFSSLRSSLQTVQQLPTIRTIGLKSKLNSTKKKKRFEEISESYVTIWSDARTRVADHFFDVDDTILNHGLRLLKGNQMHGFYATWDQKRQRTGRDREVFILDPNGKVFMHNVESLFKVVCEGVPHELITLPGNKKIVAMNMKGTQYFKTQQQLTKLGVKYENLRMTQDMTKWAPGDNVCKFIYAIAGLSFLKKSEKILYINFLCTSLRKNVIMNAVATEAVGALLIDGHIKSNERWSKMLGVEEELHGVSKRVSSNSVSVRFNWLMGVLNDTSSAVHAACAHMLKKVLEVDYVVHHYEPDVHSDDAAVDIVVERKPGNRLILLDYFPSITVTNLKRACIKLSEKKSYIDKYRKEFVSEVDDNGLMKSYWHKQAIAAISGLSYIDFFRDISEGCSKIANLVSLGGPPSVYEVAMSNVVDLTRDTYSMQPGMHNDPTKFLDEKREDLPLELGGSFTMNPIFLPITGLKYQTFSRMMKDVLEHAQVKSIDDITDEILEKLKEVEGNLFCKVWLHTTEAAVKEGLVLEKLDPGLIRFKQFSAYEKVKELRLMSKLKDYDQEKCDLLVEVDPTILFRQPTSIEEHHLKLAMLIKNNSWYSSATLQSQGALKMDRMFNVKSACCAPVLNPGQMMEKGMLTIREALKQGLKALRERPTSLFETYHLLKSMPLLCYVYKLEQEADFQKGGLKKLFPVQKEAFMTEGFIESSAVGLLQHMYTGQTNHKMSLLNYEKELDLVRMYQNSLSHLERVPQAVTIFRIFQQTTHFSSIFFVPSTKLRGYLAIQGIMANQFSDQFNYHPTLKFDPPENRVSTELEREKRMSLERKLSEVACFLMRSCLSQDDAASLLQTVTIDGHSAFQIINEAKDRRALSYALGVLGKDDYIEAPGPDEVVWIISQKKSYPTWSGPFFAYMNVGTKRKPKGLYLEGADDMIHSLILTGRPDEYPNLKVHLTKFCHRMKWKKGLTNHIKLSVPDDPEDYTMILLRFPGSSFQIKLRKNHSKGLRVSFTERGVDQPVTRFHSVSKGGIRIQVEFRGHVFGARDLNQGLSKYFQIESDARLGIFSLKEAWRRFWQSRQTMFQVPVDDVIVESPTMHAYLPQETCSHLYKIGIRVTPIIKHVFDENSFSGVGHSDLDNIDLSLFTKGSVWTQRDFNVYMSYSLQLHSKLTSWISLKGYIHSKVSDFQFINSDVLEKIFRLDTKYSPDYNPWINIIFDKRTMEMIEFEDLKELYSKPLVWTHDPEKYKERYWSEDDEESDSFCVKSKPR